MLKVKNTLIILVHRNVVSLTNKEVFEKRTKLNAFFPAKFSLDGLFPIMIFRWNDCTLSIIFL